MLVDGRREGTSLHEHAEFHVEAQRVLRQVGAGDQERLAIGDRALGVQRAVTTRLVGWALRCGPAVDLGVRGDLRPERRQAVVGQSPGALFGRLNDQPQLHAAQRRAVQRLPNLWDVVDCERDN